MRDLSVRHSAHLSDIITRHVYLFANPSEFIHRNDDGDVTVTGNNGMTTVDQTIDRQTIYGIVEIAQCLRLHPTL